MILFNVYCVFFSLISSHSNLSGELENEAALEVGDVLASWESEEARFELCVVRLDSFEESSDPCKPAIVVSLFQDIGGDRLSVRGPYVYNGYTLLFPDSSSGETTERIVPYVESQEVYPGLLDVKVDSSGSVFCLVGGGALVAEEYNLTDGQYSLTNSQIIHNVFDSEDSIGLAVGLNYYFDSILVARDGFVFAVSPRYNIDISVSGSGE